MRYEIFLVMESGQTVKTVQKLGPFLSQCLLASLYQENYTQTTEGVLLNIPCRRDMVLKISTFMYLYYSGGKLE